MFDIIQIKQNTLLPSYPPKYDLYFDVYYKDQYEPYFHKITTSYSVLKQFIFMNGKSLSIINKISIKQCNREIEDDEKTHNLWI